MLMATLQAVAELRRQLVAPVRADLPRLAEQAGALSAALGAWVERYAGRTDVVSGAGGCRAGSVHMRWPFGSSAGGAAATLPPSRLLCLPGPATAQSCQADPLGEMEAWQAAILGTLPAVRPNSPPPLQHVSALIVQVRVGQMLA